MTIVFAVVLILLMLPQTVRGGTLHNWLVGEVAAGLRRAGFTVVTEHPCRLPDGQLDFVDVYALGPAGTLACEIETTPRHVRRNARKAAALGIPLWVVVPSRIVRTAVRRCLRGAHLAPGGRPIQFPLVGELQQALTICFPLFSAASRGGKRKENKSSGPRGPSRRLNENDPGRPDAEPSNRR